MSCLKCLSQAETVSLHVVVNLLDVFWEEVCKNEICVHDKPLNLSIWKSRGEWEMTHHAQSAMLMGP